MAFWKVNIASIYIQDSSDMAKKQWTHKGSGDNDITTLWQGPGMMGGRKILRQLVSFWFAIQAKISNSICWGTFPSSDLRCMIFCFLKKMCLVVAPKRVVEKTFLLQNTALFLIKFIEILSWSANQCVLIFFVWRNCYSTSF